MSEVKTAVEQKDWGDLYRNINGKLSKYYPLHSGQSAILNSTARFSAAIGGSGGGKTVIGPLWLTQEIEKHPRGDFLIIGPTYKILGSATLPALKRAFEGTHLQSLQPYNQSSGEYKLPTGGTIYVRSADRDESFEGIQPHAIWADEVGKCGAKTWIELQRRSGSKQARILITTTPYNFGWLHSQFYSRYRNKDPNYFVVQFDSTTNPTYSPEEFERARETLPPHLFAMFHKGEFQRAEGLVLPNIFDCMCDVEEVPVDGITPIGGTDWGFNDPWATLVGVVDADDVLWVVEEVYLRGKTMDEYAPNYREDILYYCDHSRPETLRSLKKRGYNVRKLKRGCKSIEYGLTLINERINTGRLKIVRGEVSALIEEAEQYHYPSEEDGYSTGEVAVGPCHAIDALRYMIMGLDRRK